MLGLVGAFLIVCTAAVGIWIGLMKNEEPLNNDYRRNGAVVSNGVECAKIGRYTINILIFIYIYLFC